MAAFINRTLSVLNLYQEIVFIMYNVSEHAHQNDLSKANFYQTEYALEVKKSLVSVPNTVIIVPLSLFGKLGVELSGHSTGDLIASSIAIRNYTILYLNNNHVRHVKRVPTYLNLHFKAPFSAICFFLSLFPETKLQDDKL